MLNRDHGTVEQGAREAVRALDAVDEKNARYQVLFREVNERIAKLTCERSEAGASSFLCECSNPECAESIQVTPAEYERVRADGARFLVIAGHQLPELERVVDGNGRFLVVEKVGPAAAVARGSHRREYA